MSDTKQLKLAKALCDVAAQACRLKTATAAQRRRLLARAALHARQADRLRKALQRALEPVFRSMIKEVAANVEKGGTKAFCPTGPGGGVDNSCSSQGWTNQNHRLASDISGVEPDIKVTTKTLYHVTTKDNLESISKNGFDLSKVKPRWMNDYAVSLSTTQADAEKFFSKPGQSLDDKYVVLAVRVKGRFAPSNKSPVMSATGPKDYTKQMIANGVDGLAMNAAYYIHNPSSIQSIRPVSTSKAFCPTGPGGGVDNSCSSRGDSSTSGIDITVEGDISKIVGKGMTPEMLAKASGAIDGATVVISTNKTNLTVDIEHPDYKAVRTIRKDGEIENESFEVKEKGKGLGTEIFASQVKAAADAGFEKITTFAVSGPSTIGNLNGYYTWPRLGYDGPVRSISSDKLRDRLEVEFPGVERVSDMMKTPERRAWWKENGGSFIGTFDLKKNSQSRKVLDVYVAEKQRGATPGTKSGGRNDPGYDLGHVVGGRGKAADVKSVSRKILDADKWTKQIKAAAMPVIARGMAEAALSETTLTRKDIKATSATVWLQTHGGLPEGMVSEWPPWLIKEIKQAVEDTFDEPYWSAIVDETTRDDIEQVLKDGLEAGLSTPQLADRIREKLGGDYYRGRSKTIAITEAGGALNCGRKLGIEQLQQELGDEIPLRAVWLSLLKDTTRDEHANLDGVPADEDGMWDMVGYRVPWPGHYSLPANLRISCYCTIVSDFTMTPEYANGLISEYNQRVLDWQNDEGEFAEDKAFCPTGPGGGIDNSCGRGRGELTTTEISEDEWTAATQWSYEVDTSVEDAVREYQGFRAETMNSKMRRGEKLTEREAAIDEGLEFLRDNGHFKLKNKEVYRGVSNADSIEVGKTVDLSHWVSTSIKPDVAARFATTGGAGGHVAGSPAILRIKSSRGLLVGGPEAEVILEKNLSLRITASSTAIVNGKEIKVFDASVSDKSKAFCPTGPGGGIDNSCSSKVAVTGDAEGFKKYLGEKLYEVLPGITGAIPGAKVEITSVHSTMGMKYAHVKVTHSDYESERTVYEDHIENNTIEVFKPGQGLGTKIFASQVKAAADAGLEYIATTASQGDGVNGYYTWPRLGYDGKLRTDEHRDKFPDADRISDLMKTPEGRSWWKDNGGGLELAFDLKEGSQSRKVLDAYVAGKQNPASSKAFCPTGPGGGIDNSCGRGENLLSPGQVLKPVQNTRSWEASLSKEQRKAVDKWLYGGGFEAIKKAQLNPEKASAKMKETLQALNSAIESCPKFEGTVYRGMAIDGKAVSKLKETFQEGATFTTKTYMSSTDEERVVHHFQQPVYDGKPRGDVKVTMVIKSKTGRDLRDYTEGVPEVLFKDGTSMKITKYDNKKPKDIKIYLEEI